MIQLDEMNVFSWWAEQTSSGRRSRTAVLFRIKMSVCIVSCRSQKAPPQRTQNCSFSKVLLGYRPAWRWNLLCVASLQLYNPDNMSKLLCVRLQSRNATRPYVLIFASESAPAWVCLNGELCSEYSFALVSKRWHIARPLQPQPIFCNKTLFVRRAAEISILLSHLWMNACQLTPRATLGNQ